MERIDQHERIMTAWLERHDWHLRALEDHFQIRRSLTSTPPPTHGEGQARSIPEPRGEVEQEAHVEVKEEEALELGGHST